MAATSLVMSRRPRFARTPASLLSSATTSHQETIRGAPTLLRSGGPRDRRSVGDPAAPYLSDLLTRFARIENLYPRGTSIPRLETVVDMMMEIQAAWQVGTPDFRPEHEITGRRHIGDYTLFMTGLFPERVRSTASVGFYVSQGKQAYQFVSEHARTDTRGGPTPYPRLAERFENYARVLDYTRRVHFFSAPAHPFFRLQFE